MKTALEKAQQELKAQNNQLEAWAKRMGKNQQAIQNRLHEIKNAEQAAAKTIADLEAEIKQLVDEVGSNFLEYRRTKLAISDQKLTIERIESLV